MTMPTGALKVNVIAERVDEKRTREDTPYTALEHNNGKHPQTPPLSGITYLKEKTMTTFITTSIDLPANLDDLRALVESVDHLTGAALVETGHERLEIVHTDDYTMDDIEDSRATSSGEHLQWTVGVDMEDGKGTRITTKIEQPRDHLGRFTKRK